MEGFNGITCKLKHLVDILCYGQKDTGKEYTILGAGKEGQGLLQMSLDSIFAYIEATPEKEFLLRLSYFEIFNESINDLISPEKTNLQLGEASKVNYWDLKIDWNANQKLDLCCLHKTRPAH